MKFFYSFGGFCLNQNIETINRIVTTALKNPFLLMGSRDAEWIVKVYETLLLSFTFGFVFRHD